MTREQVLEVLSDVLRESERLYNANGKASYESGRIDGVKWCIDKILEEWKK